MADQPITAAVQAEAHRLLDLLNQDWTPALGYFKVDTDVFIAVILFLEQQGIGVEPPLLSPESLASDELTAAEEADMMQFAANALVDLIRARTKEDN